MTQKSTNVNHFFILKQVYLSVLYSIWFFLPSSERIDLTPAPGMGILRSFFTFCLLYPLLGGYTF